MIIQRQLNYILVSIAVKTNIILDTCTTATQLYDGFYSKGYVNQMLVQSTTLFEFYYTKGDFDTLLEDKVSNIGDITLPGMLDIATSAYTNSRIRCNAEVGGYTGYAELKAANSYGMFFNPSTTRTDGGWMYFKINNGDCIQLPSSDDKVNIYTDAAISGNLDVGGNMDITKINLSTDDPHNYPLVLTNNGGNWFQGEYTANANNVGCLFRYRTSDSSTD